MDEPTVTVQTSVQDTHAQIDELRELTGAVQLSAERQSEVLEATRECQQRLEALSTQLNQQRTEDPLLHKIMERITEIQAELAALKQSISTMKQSNHEPHQSPTEPNSPQNSQPEPNLPNEEPSIDAPEKAEQPEPKRFRRHVL